MTEARISANDLNVDCPPTLEHLFIHMPLYQWAPANDRDFMETIRIRSFQFDGHCVWCGKESTFKTMRSLGGGAGSGTARNPEWALQDAQFQVTVTCQRKAQHIYTYNMVCRDRRLMKYGQLPSVADLAGHDIKKYAKVLPSSYFGELNRATGLASHGIGIGAFVYLRRIFEKLIYDHYEMFVKDGNPVENFGGMRMSEKIDALRSALPPVLVENKSLYGILSKGIHELDEETCKRYFPVIRQGIIAILDQDLRNREAKEQARKLRAEIAAISGEVNAGSA